MHGDQPKIVDFLVHGIWHESNGYRHFSREDHHLPLAMLPATASPQHERHWSRLLRQILFAQMIGPTGAHAHTDPSIHLSDGAIYTSRANFCLSGVR